MILTALLLATRLQTAHWSLMIDFINKPKFAEMTDAEAVDGLMSALAREFSPKMEARDIEFEMLVAKPIFRARTDKVEAWQENAKEHPADHYVLIQVDKWKQKNKSAEAILGKPNSPASETSVELRLWTYDPTSGTLITPSRHNLTGKAGAGYFGTTERREMIGIPDAKAMEIRNVNRKRMQAFAKATWDAVKDSLATQ